MARRRGAVDAAYELAGMAAQRTPEEDRATWAERKVAQGWHAYAAGLMDEGRDAAAVVLAADVPTSIRARAWLVTFEAMGQRILVFVGTALALVIAVLPAAIVGGVFAVLVHTVGAGTGWTAAAWSVTGSAVLVFECYLGTMLLGPVLEKLEPAGLK